MVDRRSLWLALPRQIRTLPADLAAALLVTVLVNVSVFAPVVRETPLRVVFGLVFVLFVPGYAFIAALFPEAGESPPTDETLETGDSSRDEESTWGTDSSQEQETSEDDSSGFLGDGPMRSGIDGIERVALSFGLSIAIVPLIGLVLNFTPWGIRLVPIMLSVTGFVLITVAVAAGRRWQLPAEERFRVPYREWYQAGYSEIFEPETRLDGVLNVLLVLSIVLALGTVTWAIVVPPEGEQFSAVYILTEDDDGELVADNYPTEFIQGESQPIVLGVDNHEHRTVDYTVVTLEQTVETDGNDTVVTNQRELDRFETQLAHNESWHHPHDLTPTMVGEDIRIVWLLYPDEVPDEPSMDTTEYSVHLWVDVADSSES